jgi:hypothetical protein
MTNFEKFIRLSASTQKRIIKAARTMERLSRGAYTLTYTADMLTDIEYQRQENLRTDKAEQQRHRFA